MYTNADISLFSVGDGYAKTTIYGVFWSEQSRRAVSERGIAKIKETVLYIPKAHLPSELSIALGDIVVRGTAAAPPPEASEESLAVWHKALSGTFTVSGITVCDYGSENMQHIKVVLK